MRMEAVIAAILVMAIVAAGAWDLLLPTTVGATARSVSLTLWEWSRVNPALTLLLGMLLGHLFLPLRVHE